jgi:hypothetical protein
MSLWDALRMNMMISYQELVRTFLNNEIQEGLFQSGRIMVESLQHILSVQTGIN